MTEVRLEHKEHRRHRLDGGDNLRHKTEIDAGFCGWVRCGTMRQFPKDGYDRRIGHSSSYSRGGGFTSATCTRLSGGT